MCKTKCSVEFFRYAAREQARNVNNGNGTESNKMEVDAAPKTRSSTISCDELFKFVNDSSVSMLIMDCRPKDEFAASKLIYKDYFNVPEEIIRKGYDLIAIPSTFNVHLIK